MVSFLQSLNPYALLQRYDDWWEHDGLHFERGPIDFDALFTIVRSSKSLIEAMPGDEYVHVGTAPESNEWYLRFYVYWDEEGDSLIGRFNLILRERLSNRFREEVLGELEIEIEEEDSASYYRAYIE